MKFRVEEYDAQPVSFVSARPSGTTPNPTEGEQWIMLNFTKNSDDGVGRIAISLDDAKRLVGCVIASLSFFEIVNEGGSNGKLNPET